MAVRNLPAHAENEQLAPVFVSSVMILLSCWLSFAAAAPKNGGRNQPIIVAESLFIPGKGIDGWTVEGPRMQQAVHQVEGPIAREGDLAIEAVDRGAEMWYFTSPPHLAGDKALAYNGVLSFGVYHKQRPPASNSHPLKLGRAGVESADVILEAQCGHALYIRNVLDGPRSVRKEYALALAEEAGWVDSRTGDAPKRIDMLGVLANLHAIKIRGAFYREPEAVRLQDVRLSAAPQGAVSGRDLVPCCSATYPGEMDVCDRSAQNTDLSPRGLRFDCKGSFKETVKIKTIFPRFARRSGGVTITVTGENFGLTGSSTILRIDGRRARACRYPATEFIAGHAPTPKESLAPHCLNGQWDLGEDAVDCGGSDCPLCSIPLIPDHCRNGKVDAALGEVAAGATQNNLGQTTDCGGPCLQPEHCCNTVWEENEAGINCGGDACFACNAPALTSGTAVERAIVTAGTMSARGCFCFVGIENLTLPCPAANSTAAEAATLPIVPNTRLAYIFDDDPTGSRAPVHRYMGFVGKPVDASDCQNVVFLDKDAPKDVPDTFYVGNFLQVTGGPGVGQHAEIVNYSKWLKMLSLGPWHKQGKVRSAAINTQGNGRDFSPEYHVGSARVLDAGNGYSDGVWRIPAALFHNATSKLGAVNPEDAWGTFQTDKTSGRVVSVHISNKGRFESPYTRDKRQVLEVASANIKCSRRCAGQGARIAVGFFSDEIVAPTSQSSYIIVREEELTAPRGAKEGHLSVRPAIAQHRTLICEVDAGEGADCLVDVQSYSESGTAVWSCNTELSRGFEFGGHDYVWSMHVGIRQAIAVREVSVTSIAVDKRTADIYLVGRILGACDEGPQGCFGVVGSHLPDRGRSAAGDFNPLILDPVGSTSTFVMKLSKFAKPLWLTMADSQNLFGRIQPSSVAVDSSHADSHVYVAGTYVAGAGTVVRYWHADLRTKRPTRISRKEAEKGLGACNKAQCVNGVCTSTLPQSDEFACADRERGFKNYGACRLARCAWIAAFPSRDETQEDAWVAEISAEGRWLWVTSRLGTSRRGFPLVSGSVLLAAGELAAGVDLPREALTLGSAIYLAVTFEVQTHSWPDLEFSLGNVASEFWGLDVDKEDLEVVRVSIPKVVDEECNNKGVGGCTSTRFALVVKMSRGGVMWARRIGPLGGEGDVVSLVADDGNLYLAGNWNATSPQATGAELTLDSCKFGGAFSEFATDSELNEQPPFTNALCLPFGNIHALYTVDSWESSRPQQWDDVSGNGRHAKTSRGTVQAGFRGPSYGAASVQRFLYGDERVGLTFGAESIPANFTLCSVSRLVERSIGAVIDAEWPNWVHGHYAGNPAQAWYGTTNFQTKTGLQNDGTNSWGENSIMWDDWLVMCGQNKKADAVFLGNGVSTGISSGGYGGGQLSINSGQVSAVRGYSKWEVIEVAIWSVFLTPFEIKAAMLYYQTLLRRGNVAPYKAAPKRALFALSPKNLLVASYTRDGQLRWHREAAGGYVSTAAMALSKPNITRGGLEASTRSTRLLERHEAETQWLYVAGRVLAASLGVTDFGVAEFPRECSATKTLGAAEQIVARGQLADVYLAKYSAETGQLAWLKRMGQRDSYESAVDLVVDDYNTEVLVVGDYFNAFAGPEIYRDTFDLIAAGRASAVGCQVDRIDNQIKERTRRILTDADVGYPNCSLVGNSQDGAQISAFILSVDARNRAHAVSARPSRPVSLCDTPAELGCNADGVLWARALGTGIREASTRTTTRASGITKTPFRNQILSWGRFSGFIVATGTRGIKTQGVDDDGFFNCCLKLNIPTVFEELQDVWETFIFAMES